MRTVATALLAVTMTVGNAPGDSGQPRNFRAESHGTESIDVSGRHSGERGNPAQPGNVQRPGSHIRDTRASTTPPCPTTRWVHGIFYTEGQFCDGEMGGTEWAILLEGDEEEASGADPEPRQQFVVTRQDVQSLLVHSGSLEIQPNRSWVLVNVETIAMTDAEQHVLSTQVLGVDVDVRVTPASFSWDFGDGSPAVVGTDPGAPWPDHTVAHVYQDAQEAVISLRTEWEAEFRPAGAAVWFPVEGRAVTVATSDTIDVVTATPRLTVGQR